MKILKAIHNYCSKKTLNMYGFIAICILSEIYNYYK